MIHRIVIAALVALSLLKCALWRWTYRSDYCWSTFVRQDVWFELTLIDGVAIMFVLEDQGDLIFTSLVDAVAGARFATRNSGDRKPISARDLQRHWGRTRLPCPWRAWDLEIGLWAPAVLFLTYPAIAFACGPVRRWRRRRKGCCVKCGYNLTGNVTGVCSECGEAV